MYKKCHNDPLTGNPSNFIFRTTNTDIAHIAISLDNVDYIKFKKDISEGVELQDANGVVMTPEQVQEFLASIP